MWPFPKRHTESDSSGPSNPEAQGAEYSFSTLSIEELNTKLGKVNLELEECKGLLTGLFQQKVQGQLHDGLYNIESSAIGQRQVLLEAQKKGLLDEIGTRSSLLAHEALEGFAREA